MRFWKKEKRPLTFEDIPFQVSVTAVTDTEITFLIEGITPWGIVFDRKSGKIAGAWPALRAREYVYEWIKENRSYTEQTVQDVFRKLIEERIMDLATKIEIA